MKIKIILAASLLAVFSTSASAIVVTFDDTINTTSSGFDTQGYNFDIQSNHYHLESSTIRYGTSSSTTSLIIDDFRGDNSLTVSSIGGGAFDLNSFDIVSASSSWGSTTVDITGVQSGGGALNYTYIDSDLSTFETLLLGWTDLVSVTFNGYGNGSLYLDDNNNFFRLDNIDMVASSSVPEPASMLLMGLGLAGLGFARNKKVA